jgi:NAD(P)-dependent dehydrogenase (short-subunit alcohol dehydrogenase family)
MPFNEKKRREPMNTNEPVRHVRQLFSLAGKTALVTGGSRGLGLQIAEALGESGARVILSSRKAQDLEEAAATLRGRGIDVDWISADCSNEEDARRLADEAIQLAGGVDVLVNNAGATWGQPAEDHSVAGWDKVMNMNVRGYFVLAQQIARGSMIPRSSGRIINIASIAGLNGNPPDLKTLAYNTSKTAVIGFTRALAADWGGYGINVNCICPGFFETRMASGLLDKYSIDSMAAAAPLKRIGDSEDLKGISVLFASDAGKHITGQSVAVDGGVSVVLSTA